jgi:signal transduction histidine kinase
VLEVADDGRGLSESGDTGGYGLRAMRNRVEHVAGTVTVESAGGVGTTVRVRVPHR